MCRRHVQVTGVAARMIECRLDRRAGPVVERAPRGMHLRCSEEVIDLFPV